jgi:hypothetical protein
MKQSGKTFDGNLAFFNGWELFWSSGKQDALVCSLRVSFLQVHCKIHEPY